MAAKAFPKAGTNKLTRKAAWLIRPSRSAWRFVLFSDAIALAAAIGATVTAATRWTDAYWWRWLGGAGLAWIWAAACVHSSLGDWQRRAELKAWRRTR